MSYARTSTDDLPSSSKLAIILRSTKSLRDIGKTAAEQWADFRGKKTPDILKAYLTSLETILHLLTFIARALGIDLTGFRAAQTSIQKLIETAAAGGMTFQTFSTTGLGKITLAMRDIRLSCHDLVSDAQDVQGMEIDPTGSPLDLLIYGSDMSIILSSLVIVFKNLSANPQGIIKARNDALQFFKMISETTLESVPPAGTVEEDVPLVLAASLRKATLMLRKNPERGFQLLGSIEQRINEVWG